MKKIYFILGMGLVIVLGLLAMTNNKTLGGRNFALSPNITGGVTDSVFNISGATGSLMMGRESSTGEWFRISLRNGGDSWCGIKNATSAGILGEAVRISGITSTGEQYWEMYGVREDVWCTSTSSDGEIWRAAIQYK